MFKDSVSVVIPAYNEQANIRQVAENIYNFLNNNFLNFEIIIVDDGSQDDTQLICHALITTYKNRIVVLRHAKNRGYGATLRTGLFSAKGDLVFYTDADNQFDIRELGNFMEYITDYDLIIGYRKNRKDSLTRKLCARVFNRLIFVIFGLNVKDIDCSFKLFKRNSLKLLSIDTDEFLVDTELLVKAKLHKLKVKELPVNHLPRLAGVSTVKIRHVFSTIRDVVFLYRKLKFTKSS